jgi:hypothetical protein
MDSLLGRDQFGTGMRPLKPLLIPLLNPNKSANTHLASVVESLDVFREVTNGTGSRPASSSRSLLLQQMPPQDGNLLARRVVLPWLLHAFSPSPYRENAVSISS